MWGAVLLFLRHRGKARPLMNAWVTPGSRWRDAWRRGEKTGRRFLKKSLPRMWCWYIAEGSNPGKAKLKNQNARWQKTLNTKSEILNNIKWPKSEWPSSGFCSCLIHQALAHLVVVCWLMEQAQLPNKLGNYIFKLGLRSINAFSSSLLANGTGTIAQ